MGVRGCGISHAPPWWRQVSGVEPETRGGSAAVQLPQNFVVMANQNLVSGLAEVASMVGQQYSAGVRHRCWGQHRRDAGGTLRRCPMEVMSCILEPAENTHAVCNGTSGFYGLYHRAEGARLWGRLKVPEWWSWPSRRGERGECREFN